MDPRRLDTMGVMASGVLGMAPPKTEIPKDREKFDPRVNDDEKVWIYGGNDGVIAALESGKLVEVPNYYGIPYVWKQADGVYRGTLLQYRAVTEDPTFATVEECADWFERMYYQTDG